VPASDPDGDPPRPPPAYSQLRKAGVLLGSEVELVRLVSQGMAVACCAVAWSRISADHLRAKIVRCDQVAGRPRAACRVEVVAIGARVVAAATSLRPGAAAAV
jgi:hypothetical protein